LGFKGIWRSNDPESVAKTLQDGRRIAEEMARDVLVGDAVEHVLHAAGNLPDISAVAFSDTFLFAATVPQAKDRQRALAGAAGLVACGLSSIVRTTALGPVPLTFRGVIATGECIVDPQNRVFIGPAVDEAAELMDMANGAFTWLAPSAMELDYSGWRNGFWGDVLVDYRVPLKDGRSILTKVVNPFALTSHGAEDFKQIRQNHSKAMKSGSVDVEVKRQNTEALFDHFERLSRKHMENMERENELRMSRIRKT
jgi:hypothetical protein